MLFLRKPAGRPVGLAEVIDASEASLGAPGAGSGWVRWVVIMVYDLAGFPCLRTRWQ